MAQRGNRLFNSADDQIRDIFLIFPRKQDLTFPVSCMKCQILFSEKNKKNISKYCLLKILPKVLSAKFEKLHFATR